MLVDPVKQPDRVILVTGKDHMADNDAFRH